MGERKSGPGTATEAKVGLSGSKTRANAADAQLPMLIAALDYAARGWYVFPVPPGTKKSYKSAEFSEGRRWGATTDAAEIKRNWRRWPSANIGICTGAGSGIWLIDADTAAGHGVDGLASLRELEAKHGRLPVTLMARTPSGGEHRIYKHPGNDIKIKTTAGVVPGLDVRGDGGMFVAPPSVKGDVAYEWINNVPIAAAPQWLLNLVVEHAHVAPAVVPLVPDDDPEFEAEIKSRSGMGTDPAWVYETPSREEVQAALNAVPAENYYTWLYVGAALFHEFGEGGRDLFLSWSATSSSKFKAVECEEKWRECQKLTEHTVATIFHYANEHDPDWWWDWQAQKELPPPPEKDPPPKDPPPPPPPKNNPPPLPFIDMSRWDTEPVPEIQWTVPNRIPRRQCCLFTGEGAAGKSTVDLHRSVAHVLGRDWLGTTPERGPALFVDAEDEKDVIHVRLAAICRYYDVKFVDLIKRGLHIVSLVGADAVLATASRSGKIVPTPLYQRVMQAVGDIKPISITIASSANIYAGSEIDRSQVQQFISLLTRLAMLANGSLTLISHPSLTGISSGSGLSGVTAWHNSVRARMYLKGIKPENGAAETDNGLRELVFMKNNYGPINETITLRYQNGLFLPVGNGASFNQATRDAKADAIFLDLLRRFTREGRYVGVNSGRNYAPALFAVEEEATKHNITKKLLEGAMRRLLRAGTLGNEGHGKPSRPAYRLVIKRLV